MTSSTSLGSARSSTPPSSSSGSSGREQRQGPGAHARLGGLELRRRLLLRLGARPRSSPRRRRRCVRRVLEHIRFTNGEEDVLALLDRHAHDVGHGLLSFCMALRFFFSARFCFAPASPPPAAAGPPAAARPPGPRGSAGAARRRFACVCCPLVRLVRRLADLASTAREGLAARGAAGRDKVGPRPRDRCSPARCGSARRAGCTRRSLGRESTHRHAHARAGRVVIVRVQLRRHVRRHRCGTGSPSSSLCKGTCSPAGLASTPRSAALAHGCDPRPASKKA